MEIFYFLQSALIDRWYLWYTYYLGLLLYVTMYVCVWRGGGVTVIPLHIISI